MTIVTARKTRMTRLESYRLAQYAVQVPCYICDQGNTFDSELCRHCQAPLALAHQARSQKVKPQMVATIGTTGFGASCVNSTV